MKHYKLLGIIFDMDGLMFDTESLFLIAEKKLAKQYGRKMTRDTFHRMQGLLGLESMKVFAKDLEIKENPKLLFKQRSLVVYKLLESKLRPMFGLFDLLKFLKKNNFKLAIATSASLKWLNAINKQYGVKKYFSVIVTADQVRRGKPSPDIFLKAAKQLGILPKNILVLEDASNGLAAAKNGGFRCAVVRDKHHRQIKFSNADLIVTKLNSRRLLNYIKKYA
ncbi:MAG: HAD-IA family hydrolase [Patescibacteria group bacterium]|jgi:HAD superfamily hydrolase (TIGR01509 family)